MRPWILALLIVFAPAGLARAGDGGLWRIMGFQDDRFHAGTSRLRMPDGFGPGSPVFFYESRDGENRLAGAGTVDRIEKRPGFLRVEARIDFFRYPDRRPGRRRWFMSPDLKGPDTRGWGTAEVRAFRHRRLWEGMPEAALLAITGPPLRVEGASIGRVYRPDFYGVDRIVVENGRVTRILMKRGR